MNSAIRRIGSLPYGFAIFLGAWLIFQIQPLMSKVILPLFGGSPQVWTVCLLFFQSMLFAGYAFAHVLDRRCSPRWRVVIYIGMVVFAGFITTIVPRREWHPVPDSDPTSQIIWLLFRCVGLPYFLLSATGPLLQSWHHRATSSESAYWLYALSNAGSLLGLLTYPFVIDIFFSADNQALIWMIIYVSYSAWAGVCGYLFLSSQAERIDTSSQLRTPISVGHFFVWFALAMVPTTLLAAVTSKLSTDVSPVPFLWVMPLTIYLLSLIVCFADERWYHRTVWSIAFVVLATLSCSILIVGDGQGTHAWITVQFLVYLGLLLSSCMICHGELVRSKPSPERLTDFYLIMSAGGAAGGIFTGIVAPLIFSFFAEFHIATFATWVMVMIVCYRDQDRCLSNARYKWILTSLVLELVVLSAGLGTQIVMTFRNSSKIMRTFYGVLRIDEHGKDRPRAHYLEMGHGGTRHGLQYQHPDLRRVPVSYYGFETGVGLALRNHRIDQQRRIGVVGLGVGTLAAYGRAGDHFDFYEIDPAVIRCAQVYFYYLSDSQAEVRIVPGDARLSLESRDPGNYDILILDAFSSDAVPIHLLTEEAFGVYLKHIQSDGIVALHISSRYFDFLPVVVGNANRHHLTIAAIEHLGDPKQASDPCLWVLLAHDPNTLTEGDLGKTKRISLPAEKHWTDSHSSLFSTLRTW